MDRVCRWCKHYEAGECHKLADNVTVCKRRGMLAVPVDEDKLVITIYDPENFYCKEWE